jgi:hypothetical protein
MIWMEDTDGTRMDTGGTVTQRHTLVAPSGYASVEDAVRAFKSGELDSSAFVEAVTALPHVSQTKKPDHERWGDWAQNQGPLFDLMAARRNGFIPMALYDTAVVAMAKAGHEA